MAPLDTGSVVQFRTAEPLGARSGPRAEGHATLGAFLQAAREHKGVPLGDIAETTRIKITHLRAIEADDWGALPSRPFALGYIRAVAKAVGVEPEPLVERFRREVPDQPAPLQPPVGLAGRVDDRRPVAYAAVAALFAAVVLWNLAQRVLHAEEGPPRPDLAPAVAAAAPVEPAGPLKLSAPTPAPAEQSTPAPYVTPGLEEATGASTTDAPPARKAAEGLLTAPAAPRAFETRGAVYGEPANRSSAVLLARNPSAVVVRDGGGRIWFARSLTTGEAYRLPLGRGLTAELSDPTALDLYVGGQLRGTLTTVQTPIDRLGASTGPTPMSTTPLYAIRSPRPATPAAAASPAATTAAPVAPIIGSATPEAPATSAAPSSPPNP